MDTFSSLSFFPMFSVFLLCVKSLSTIDEKAKSTNSVDPVEVAYNEPFSSRSTLFAIYSLNSQ